MAVKPINCDKHFLKRLSAEHPNLRPGLSLEKRHFEPAKLAQKAERYTQDDDPYPLKPTIANTYGGYIRVYPFVRRLWRYTNGIKVRSP
jgi:hypothetical protein